MWNWIVSSEGKWKYWFWWQITHLSLPFALLWTRWYMLFSFWRFSSLLMPSDWILTEDVFDAEALSVWSSKELSMSLIVSMSKCSSPLWSGFCLLGTSIVECETFSVFFKCKKDTIWVIHTCRLLLKVSVLDRMLVRSVNAEIHVEMSAKWEEKTKIPFLVLGIVVQIFASANGDKFIMETIVVIVRDGTGSHGILLKLMCIVHFILYASHALTQPNTHTQSADDACVALINVYESVCVCSLNE